MLIALIHFNKYPKQNYLMIKSFPYPKKAIGKILMISYVNT